MASNYTVFERGHAESFEYSRAADLRYERRWQ